MIYSYCNYADLRATIFGLNRNEIRAEYGLPAVYGNCLNCDEPLPSANDRFCNIKCRHDYSWIDVACSQCGKLTKVRRCILIYRTNRPQSYSNKLQQRWFCSTTCRGRYVGRTYGFGVHKKFHNPRTHNYDLILHIKRETGFGARKLSRLLKIPESTISSIIARGICE